MGSIETPVVIEQPLALHGKAASPLNPTRLDSSGPPATATHNTSNNHVQKPTFELEDRPIDRVRPIKVGIIGAGIAGITAGILLPAKLPGLDLRIYDKNPEVVCLSRPAYSMY